MSELIPPVGYKIEAPKDREAVLIPDDRTREPIRITNRGLHEVDKLFGRKLIPLINQIKMGGVNKSSIRVLDCVAGSDSSAAIELACTYPDVEVYALDFLTRRMSSPKNFQGIKADTFNIPLASGTIDFAYCYGFAYYFQKEKRYDQMNSAMGELARVLAPSGQTIVSAEYGDFQKHKIKFESETGTKIEPLPCGYLFYGDLNLFNRLTILLTTAIWADDRYILMKKLPNSSRPS